MQSSVDPTMRTAVISLIHKYWDCFYEAGAQHPILGFEFSLDTGASPPVCCRAPHYGVHETKVMLDQLDTLKHNGWIEECSGPWGSMIVLAPKPHQETVEDINDFVWRMCVSYRGLNAITLPFEYPIPRCNDALDNFGDSLGTLSFISLDARSGYHQISVKPSDREKLAFFGPDGRKWTFNIMPFGVRNGPAFYTSIMRILEMEWETLYDDRKAAQAHTSPTHHGTMAPKPSSMTSSYGPPKQPTYFLN